MELKSSGTESFYFLPGYRGDGRWAEKSIFEQNFEMQTKSIANGAQIAEMWSILSYTYDFHKVVFVIQVTLKTLTEKYRSLSRKDGSGLYVSLDGWMHVYKSFRDQFGKMDVVIMWCIIYGIIVINVVCMYLPCRHQFTTLDQCICICIMYHNKYNDIYDKWNQWGCRTPFAICIVEYIYATVELWFYAWHACGGTEFESD